MPDVLDGLDLLSRVFEAAIQFRSGCEVYRRQRRIWTPDLTEPYRRGIADDLESALSFVDGNASYLRRKGLHADELRESLERIGLMIRKQMMDAYKRISESQLRGIIYKIDAAREAVPDACQGFRSADELGFKHGIRRNRLATAASASLVKKMPAPKSYPPDSQGRRIRVLYCEEDAIKHCLPRHVKKSTRR